jgi:O-antigen/teichoic acid export membrane protein
MSYSGWNLFGAVAGILNNQGINILLNIFFGPIVNAARAIAYRVNDAVNQFVMNFLTAVRPQITKYYAAEEKEKMMKMVFQSSKFSYFLLFLLSMPVLLETNFIFKLWLKETPQYVVLFTKLVIITALIDSLSYPLMTAAQATGKIKLYQTVVGGTMLLTLPISYCFLKMGFPPQITMYIAIVISIICFFLRLYLLKSMVDLSIRDYFKKVIIVILSVSLMAYIIPVLITISMKECFRRFIFVSVISLVISAGTIYLIGLTKDEKHFTLQLIRNKLKIKVNTDQ